MIAPSTSSGEEQLALMGDRIECLKELSQTIKTSNGIPILDKMFFFVGTNLLSNLSVEPTSVVRVAMQTH